MNPEVKQKWLTALRSGEYKQSQQKLKTTEGYCCLGVLCDIHAKEGLGEWVDKGEHFSYRGLQETQTLNGTLPVSVRGWAGISYNGQLNTNVEDKHSLIALNDFSGYDFNEIAEVIEEQF